MQDSILTVSGRGGITIPQKIRKKIHVKHLICTFKNGKIILEPLQTREEFLQELDEAEKDWLKNGGSSLEKVMKKSHKLP